MWTDISSPSSYQDVSDAKFMTGELNENIRSIIYLNPNIEKKCKIVKERLSSSKIKTVMLHRQANSVMAVWTFEELK